MNGAIKQIRSDEGLRLMPYRCTAGKLTIGIGRNVEDRGINADEAELMFSNDIAECLDDLETLFPEWGNFTDGIQGGFLNMRFQLGPGGFRKFEKMITAANEYDTDEVVFQAKDSKWYKHDTPERAKRVVEMLKH